jgi:hypothetical protein
VEASERERVIEFLDRSVIGRTVASRPVTTRTNDGLTEATYVDQSFFSNLVRTDFGFAFDMTTLTQGQRYGLNKDGQRVELAGTLDAVRVVRYQITQRPSSGKLLGFAHLASSTNADFDPLTGVCFLVRMRLDNDGLLVHESQMGYGDFVSPGGARHPMAIDGSFRYQVSDGRLVVHFQQASFNVDPETLQRVPSGETFPPQIAEEFGTSDRADEAIAARA